MSGKRKRNRFKVNALKKLTRLYGIKAVKEYSEKYSFFIQCRFAKYVHRNSNKLLT
jgi:hypothetical protein